MESTDCSPAESKPRTSSGVSRLQDHLVSPTTPKNSHRVPDSGKNVVKSEIGPLLYMLHSYTAIQWFGVDIGGTLVKCVYYETKGSVLSGVAEGGESGENQGVLALRTFLKSNLKYGSTGQRDEYLELVDQCLGSQTGTLHFLKFATCRMSGFFDMVTKNGLGSFSKVVCATGGGAFKFESDFKEVIFLPILWLCVHYNAYSQKLGINLCKFDEMESLIRGLHYLAKHCVDECYYWKNPKQEDTCKVPFQLGPDPYPYIIVNIGSGVSILLVESATSFRRIGGTSVGKVVCLT